MKDTDIRLQTLHEKDMILILENSNRGGRRSVVPKRFVKSDETKKILYIDACSLYGLSGYQSLPYDEIKCDKNVSSEDILNTPDDSDVSYFGGFDLKYSDEIKHETKNLPLCPLIEFSPRDNFSNYMKDIKQSNYTKK